METLELLEELLSEYPGTVLLVSHDRNFIDQVVTSCLVFEGQGRVSEHIGGYSDWSARGGRLVSQPSPDGDQPLTVDVGTPARKASSQPPKIRKLGYKKQRELAQLPGRIETLEQEIANLQTEINHSDFYNGAHAQVASRLGYLAQLEANLEQALERWVEIESD